MNRLELHDLRWARLRGGYRTPENFTELLRDLSSAPTPDLWNAIHHQGNVDLGSYASLPYLMDAAESATAQNQFQLGNVLLDWQQDGLCLSCGEVALPGYIL